MEAKQVQNQKFSVKRFFHKIKNSEKLKGNGKRVFWIWVAYQAIKGTLTTSLIWIPLIYMWFHSQ